MRLCVLALCVLACVGVEAAERTHVASPFLPPCRLSLQDEDFLDVMAGNPGRTLRLRLDLTSDEVILYEPLSQTSQTFYMDEERVSEIFYFGHYKLRLPVRFGANPDDVHSALYHSSTHQGVLGLARHSPLWRHWRNMTLTLDTLLLGGYDAFLQRSSSYHGPALPLEDAFTMHDQDETTWRVRVNLSDMDTHVPDPYYLGMPLEVHAKNSENCDGIYRELGFEDAYCERGWSLTLEPSSYRIELPSGFEYRAVQRTHGDVVLGRALLRKYVLFVDWMYERVVVAPSYATYAKTSVNLLYAALLLGAVLTWTLVSLDEVRDERTHVLLSLLQFYAHTLTVLMYVTNVWGLDIARMASHYTHTTPWFALIYVGVVVALGIVVYVVEGAPATSLRSLSLERSALLHAAAASLWLALLEHHEDAIEVMMLLLLTTASTVVLSVSAALALTHSTRGAWVEAVGALLANVATLRLSAYAALGGEGLYAYASTIFYWVALVAAPTLFLYISYELKRLRGRPFKRDILAP